jgi:tetratricopeptide (TPR) repeat protein
LDPYDYHDYLSAGFPDSEKIPSLGMCFRNAKDYVHVAIVGYTWPDLQKTVLHELTHSCLSHLTLPLWLEEGVTQLAEEEGVPSWSRFSLDAAQAKELREFWRANGLREFWWESGFQAMDEVQSYSYQLAQVLFRLLLSDHRPKIADLLRHADGADAGDAAAREFLGISVADLAAKFLGEGDWKPFPANGHGYWRRGVFHLWRDEYDLAISDFNEAAQLEPRFGDIFADRGLAHFQLGNYGAAISDYELALTIQWRHANALNNLSWLLATCPEDQFRNGVRAVKCATRACELVGYDVWYCVGTLAAALAEAGDFDRAAEMAAQSLRLAPEHERFGCRSRLLCYRSGLPYREYQRPPLRISALAATDISRRGDENVER